MTPKQRQQKEEARNKRFRDAMASLLGNVAFGEFIQRLREERENAMDEACHTDFIANERIHLTALGEVRCYKAIISLYDEAVAVPPEEETPSTE